MRRVVRRVRTRSKDKFDQLDEVWALEIKRRLRCHEVASLVARIDELIN